MAETFCLLPMRNSQKRRQHFGFTMMQKVKSDMSLTGMVWATFRLGKFIQMPLLKMEKKKHPVPQKRTLTLWANAGQLGKMCLMWCGKGDL